jgi:hypothetical protein
VAELRGADELERAQGAVVAERSGQCISRWEEHALDIGFDNERVSLGTEEQVTLGSLVLTNGGIGVQTGGSRCSDAYVAYARAAAWPSEFSVPRASGIGGWCDRSLTEARRSGSYYADKDFVCLSDAAYPHGYLSLPCQADSDCLPGAACDGRLCRAP